MIGVVVCKHETHCGGPMHGYIAMLAVKEQSRGKGIARDLVKIAIKAMLKRGTDEVLFMLTVLLIAGALPITTAFTLLNRIP